MDFIRKSTPFLLATLSLALAIWQFVTAYSSAEWRNPPGEMTTQWENRVQPLREALPKGATQVGYMDDSALNGDPSLLDVNEFQLMQYSAAPVAIDLGTNHEWIVGNFNDDENLETRLGEKLGKHETQGFGFGLYLIHDLDD